MAVQSETPQVPEPTQYGVPPEQTTVSCQSPFASHVCTVFVTPLLHRVAPVTHTRQFPAVHVPVSVPTAHAVPFVLFATPQALPVQVAAWQVFAGGVHWDASVQATQLVVVASQ